MSETETHNPNHQPLKYEPDTLNPNLMDVLGEPDQAVVDALHPDDLTLQDDIEGTISALHRLPFLKTKEVRQSLEYPEGATAGQQIEDATFPVSRIVSVSGFQSWAGRGISKGEVSSVGGYSSASAIRHYAETEPNADYQPTIHVFKDKDGIVWGFMNTDGAHRTAGAKARGDRELKCTVHTNSYDRLPTSNLSIAETLLAQDKKHKRFFGKAAMRWQTKNLAKNSQLFDQRQASQREQDGDGWL